MYQTYNTIYYVCVNFHDFVDKVVVYEKPVEVRMYVSNVQQYLLCVCEFS